MRLSITRRSLLAVLAAAAVPAKAAATHPAAPRAIELLCAPIAGLAYYDYQRLARSLGVDTGVALQREPANPHDPRAIAVLTVDGAKLGYVPRADNAALASLMDAGYALQAEILEVVDPDVWPRLWIMVSLLDERM